MVALTSMSLRRGPALLPPARPQIIGRGEEIIVSILLAGIIPLLIVLGIFEFSSWGQVDVLWSYRLPPSALAYHPHYYRYLVVYPGFLLTDLTSDVAFSLYIAGFLLTGQYLLRVMILPTSRLYALIAQAIYVAVHFFVNGRGAIAWGAWVLAIYAINDAEINGWRVRHGVMTALATLGAAVSSGTLMVVYLTTIILSLSCVFTPGKRLGALYMLPGISYFLSYSLLSVDKNISYYQEGNTTAILNMLEHGWGALLERSSAVMFVAAAAIIILPFVVHYYATRYSVSRLVILLAPIGGGAFGFTTLTLVVPSLLVVLLEHRSRKR